MVKTKKSFGETLQYTITLKTEGEGGIHYTESMKVNKEACVERILGHFVSFKTSNPIRSNFMRTFSLGEGMGA